MPAKKKVTPTKGTARAPRAKKAAPIEDTPENRAQAIADLGIDVPIYTVRVVGGRLELHCYGGQVKYWPGL